MHFCLFILFQSAIFISHTHTHTHQSPNMSTGTLHVLAYPFPASGHVIPLMDFAKVLLSRGVKVTILVTPKTEPLVPTTSSPLLQTLLLPEPQFSNPNLKNLANLMNSMRHLHHPLIVDWAKTQSTPPSAIISDYFLGWTRLLGHDLHVPHLVFSPCSAISLSVINSLWRDAPQNDNPQDPNSVVSFPNLPNSPVYPWWQITHLYTENERGGPEWELHRENTLFNIDSWGFVFNTFNEAEQVYIEHIKKELGHKRVWAVGPVIPIQNGSAEPVEHGGNSTVSQDELLEWLDSREECSVIYVCFGSLAVLTSSQMEVLGHALELSGVNFVLSVRVLDAQGKVQGKAACGFMDREGVKGRGFFIEGWAPQMIILNHRAVGAFLNHSGWNSMVEALLTGVVMVTWPTGGDQYPNARLFVDELGVAIPGAEGEKLPEARELAKSIEKALGRTKERVKAEELKEAALRAVGNGGSSQRELDDMLKLLKQVQLGKNTA